MGGIKGKKMKENIIGIIGCGHWGPNFIRNFNHIEGTFVKYACDLSASRLSHIKDMYPGIITTQNFLQVLKDRQVDAVVIATTTDTHYRLAKEALLYNKHVLIEKPIATGISQAEELITLAEDNRRTLMVGHIFKFNPAINKLKWLIDRKELGRIYYMYSRRTNLGPLRKDVNAIWDLAPHDISIFNYLLNRTSISVAAKGEKYLPHNLEDVCFISLTFPGHIFAHIHVSWLDPKKVREIVVVGSKKMAVFDDLNTEHPLSIYDRCVMKKKFKQDYDSFEEFKMIIKDGKIATPLLKKAEPLRSECSHFIECIRKDKKPLTDGKDGLETIRVLKAIQDSLSKNGSEILTE